MFFAFLAGFVHYANAISLHSWGINDINSGEWSEVIERDVCVVGGGVSGVHAAVSLTDLNKTIVIVEQNNRLRGHTETYIEPEIKAPVDISVVIFQPVPAANMLGEPANAFLPAFAYATWRKDLDFRDRTEVVHQTYSRGKVADAFQRMSGILSQYDYIEHDYDLPDPKHNLTAAVVTVCEISQGMEDLFHIPIIYVAKYFNTGDICALTQGWLIHTHGNTSEIYSNGGEYILYNNILLESFTMQTCKAELLHDVLSRYASANGYCTGLVRNIGLNQMISYSNQAASMPFDIPVLPAMYRFIPVGVIDDVYAIVTQPGCLIFENHSPFHIQVTSQEVQRKFFKQLTSLKDRLGRTMFYTGAAFHTHYSSLLWRFNEEGLIPRMMEFWQGSRG
ncbi:hypothetical protein F5Y09DRAFT_354936 [Xylaria sp. FL1042]|nr:hypothetical protein F5Y09DRAFT_354936 [Xylaria sp. FL1042]